MPIDEAAMFGHTQVVEFLKGKMQHQEQQDIVISMTRDLMKNEVLEEEKSQEDDDLKTNKTRITTALDFDSGRETTTPSPLSS
jgi:hypothetical protein